MRYLFPSLLFLANNEAVSTIALFIIVCILFYDFTKSVIKAKEER